MNKFVLFYVNVVLKIEKDSVFVIGIVSNEEGCFIFFNVKLNNYYFEIFFIGYVIKR